MVNGGRTEATAVPFVVSWSLMDALACGCAALVSDTPPEREVIRQMVNGLLADFFDVEQLARQAPEVLDDPPAYRHLGQAGLEMIHAQYSLDVTLPKMLDFYSRVCSRRGESPVNDFVWRHRTRGADFQGFGNAGADNRPIRE